MKTKSATLISSPKESDLRSRIIRYKRIIIQLTIIVVAVVAIAISLSLFGDPLHPYRISIISGATGIIAAAIISIADYFFLKKDEDESGRDVIRIIERIENVITKGAIGIKLHKLRTDIDFVKLIQDSHSEICIYNTNLNFMYNYATVLNQAAQRNVTVKVLGLNPCNLFIATRFHELGIKSPDDFFAEIRTSILNIYKKLNEIENVAIRNQYQVKLYISQPTHMIFKFDKCLIVSFILRQGRARDQVHIEFDLNNPEIERIASDFVQDFNLIWTEADPLDDAMIQRIESKYNTRRMEAKGIGNATKFYKQI